MNAKCVERCDALIGVLDLGQRFRPFFRTPAVDAVDDQEGDDQEGDDQEGLERQILQNLCYEDTFFFNDD